MVEAVARKPEVPPLTDAQKKLLRLITQHYRAYGIPLTVEQLSILTGQHRSTVEQKIRSLCKRGHLSRPKRGVYIPNGQGDVA